MLKIYTYSIDAIWPHKEKPGGSLRLDDQVEQVVDPDAADFVIVPPSIHDFENRHLDIASLLPHLKGREEKHEQLSKGRSEGQIENPRDPSSHAQGGRH